ncbi:hypothetical protein PAXINDRAFT_15790 [Paxillus involutus ATCC 200175]|uniref:DUF6830 domain-containing protein n=1 Tax=Paxillus involutus ATCC 200175 TaxID=664439 RepID=A0A0C9SSK5_PAXIN|nr:hypothetical protein PAXINDRAFT_15790 [Paxillus involutus ATCC 200175]
MSDPVGNLRLCYMPIAAYIIDTPEALMLACVRGLTSHLTLAMFKTLVILSDTLLVKWCLAIVGKKELDFWYSVLQQVVGLFHFKSGVSKLKQVTGRAQRDLQHYIVGVIAGAAAPSFVIAICALSDFCYLSQSPIISKATREKIKNALQEFHNHKKTIIDLGACCGKKNHPLKHWHIPKLELMQSIVPSITAVGSLLQWSADMTEHAHIAVINDPAEATNNHEYNPQICQFLDRQEKCRLFDHTTRLSTVNKAVHTNEDAEDDVEEQEDDEHLDKDNTNPAATFNELWGSNHQPTNFFRLVSNGRNGPDMWPPCTFLAGCMAVHLNARPSIPWISIDNIANTFSLPDLWAAFADYYRHNGPSFHDLHTFGHPRRAAQDAPLCFDDVEVWHKVQVQQKLFHDPSIIC